MTFAIGAHSSWELLTTKRKKSPVIVRAPSMPKEEDHRKDEGNKDSKEERTQDAPEETVRKRVRANTPSPHRGNTPQGEQ